MRCARYVLGALAALLVSLLPYGPADAANDIPSAHQQGQKFINRVLVTDGTNVHNVGRLHVHVGNWGVFGSYPGTSYPFSSVPSAQWPASSGVEYLYACGLWVGAEKNGIQSVSTSMYEWELLPTMSVTDIIYNSYEGALGGTRLPDPGSDDDGDGCTDEDWLDGRDNDGDGCIDEDYAAISAQMFSCWYTDDQPDATAYYPEHKPLNITVRQESYQWEEKSFYDFVGIRYIVTNTGNDLLENVYLGFFVDPDVGPRSRPYYWQDDAVASWRGLMCTENGPVSLDMGYAYDVDADGGQTPGYAGFMLLGHTTDPLGIKAPERAGIASLQYFEGELPYEYGGDPTSDYQRYELMSSGRFDRDSGSPGDHRMLISTGPFPRLAPGETIEIHLAIVLGMGRQGMLENAAAAQDLFNGVWCDIDGDPLTGIDRRETPVHGPAQVVIDACRPELSDPVTVPRGSVVWINSDCGQEDDYRDSCGYGEQDSLLFRTGVAGREHRINWLSEGQSISLDILDILPCVCPNPFPMSLFNTNDRLDPSAWDILPVAVLGNPSLDVREIDISTVLLEGVAPTVHHSIRDKAGLTEGRQDCECTTAGPDGLDDLMLKFPTVDLVEVLSMDGIPTRGEERMLTLTGLLLDGTAFRASDCLRFVGEMDLPEHTHLEPRITAAYPNPFNPVTRLSYYIPDGRHVRLSVYDVSGRLIEVLVDGYKTAGDHTVSWNAEGLGSGVYFQLLESGDYSVSGKLILLR